ncbi:MAG: helix-turn-helix domain-containing protein [Candidatus Accumulibacter sp.]|jgi:transposase|nr:helix-turn-helix domain-containing protein [Accumulibacter sp.]
MRAYSQDLRERVLKALERGEGPTGIARRFEVSRMWVYQVRRRWEREGNRESLRQGGYRVSCIAHLEETIRGWITAEVDLTLAELIERLKGVGIRLKVPALWQQLNKWGLRYKKNAARRRARARRRATGAGSLDSGAAAAGHKVVEIH